MRFLLEKKLRFYIKSTANVASIVQHYVNKIFLQFFWHNKDYHLISFIKIDDGGILLPRWLQPAEIIEHK